MKCCCCDKILNNFESTRKSKTTGDYLDMCNRCYSTIKDDVKTVDREDVSEDDDVDVDIILEADSFNYEDLGYNNEE